MKRVSGSWLLAFLAAGAVCQEFSATPQSVRPGETLKVQGDKSVKQIRIGEQTEPLFAQTDGTPFGLFPVRMKEHVGKHEVQFLDETGTVVHTLTVVVRPAHYGAQNVVLSRALVQLHSSAEERETMDAFQKRISAVRYWEEPLGLPVEGCMTSLFGVERLHNGKPTGDYHGGVDQRAAAGTPIRAVAGGVVQVARQFELRGGTAAIDHGQGFESVYLHMSRVAATEGAIVKKGDIIGYVGSTGRSTAPHLHWALYVDGQPVNPEQWVSMKPCASPTAQRPNGNATKHG